LVLVIDLWKYTNDTMEFKSKKDHRAEYRKQEKEQSRSLNAANDRMRDQRQVSEVAKQLRGGTAEGREAVRSRLESAVSGLSADFERHMEAREQTGQKIEASRREDEAERDGCDQDARNLADAAGAVGQSEVKRGLEQGRDASAEDAVFFSEQERKREHMGREGDRLIKGMRGDMNKLEKAISRLAEGSLSQLEAGVKQGAQILSPHKDDQTGLGYKAPFDVAQVGRSGNEVRNVKRDKKDPHYDVIERTPEGDHFHHRIYQPDKKDDS